MLKLRFFNLVSASLLFSLQAFTAEEPSPQNPYPYGIKKTASAQKPPPKEPSKLYTDRFYDDGCSFWFRAKHREANGIGYDQGYTSLDGFFTFNTMGEWHPFFDVRAHIFNDGHPAGNLGFGLRYLPDNLPAVFGINGFYDIKSTSHSTFQQAGLGIEVMGTHWEMHANGYFPIFGSENLYAIGFDKFQGHKALFKASSEVSFKGFDLSVGRKLLQKNFFSLSSALGGYMFFADYDKQAKGGLVKFKSQITPFFSVETQASYDSYFKGILQIQAAFNIPFGKQIRTKTKGMTSKQSIFLARRLAQEVDRFEMIVSDKHGIYVTGEDPRSETPLNIVFVDNTKASGDGSFEAPYDTLIAAQDNSSPGDMIYVFGGTGTPLKMSDGITLKQGQWLQGGANPFVLSTPYGLGGAPALSSLRPSVMNMTGSAVILNDDNIITGFDLRASVSGILGTGIEKFTAEDNHLLLSSIFDINLLGPSGEVILKNNTSSSPNGLKILTESDINIALEGNTFTNSNKNLDIDILGSSIGLITISKSNTFEDAEIGSSIVTRGDSSVLITVRDNFFTSTATSDNYNLTILTTANAVTGVIIKDNSFSSSMPAIELLANLKGTADWAVLNNVGQYSGDTVPTYPFRFFTTSISSADLYLINNIASNNGYALINDGALSTFQAVSPTVSLSGLETTNTGSFSTTGTIEYLPVSP